MGIILALAGLAVIAVLVMGLFEFLRLFIKGAPGEIKEYMKEQEDAARHERLRRNREWRKHNRL